MPYAKAPSYEDYSAPWLTNALNQSVVSAFTPAPMNSLYKQAEEILAAENKKKELEIKEFGLEEEKEKKKREQELRELLEDPEINPEDLLRKKYKQNLNLEKLAELDASNSPEAKANDALTQAEKYMRIGLYDQADSRLQQEGITGKVKRPEPKQEKKKAPKITPVYDQSGKWVGTIDMNDPEERDSAMRQGLSLKKLSLSDMVTAQAVEALRPRSNIVTREAPTLNAPKKKASELMAEGWIKTDKGWVKP